MTNTNHKKERRLSVRSARRSQPDLRRLARVLIEYATAQAEAEAARHGTDKPGRRGARKDAA